jgi:hypothetical protein
MFRIFWRKPRAERPDFGSFLLDQAGQNRHISLEDTLADYIVRYGLVVRKSLDEPDSISAARTRLQILEETSFADPTLCHNPHVKGYIAALRAQVAVGDEGSPELFALMRARERKKA